MRVLALSDNLCIIILLLNIVTTLLFHIWWVNCGYNYIFPYYYYNMIMIIQSCISPIKLTSLKYPTNRPLHFPQNADITILSSVGFVKKSPPLKMPAQPYSNFFPGKRMWAICVVSWRQEKQRNAGNWWKGVRTEKEKKNGPLQKYDNGKRIVAQKCTSQPRWN